MEKLESWGHKRFIWEEDHVYLHTTRKTGSRKVSYYYVDEVENERIKGFNIITGKRFSENYKTFFIQEFEKPDYRIMIDHLFRYDQKVL